MGILLTLASALSWSIGTLFYKRSVKGGHPLALALANCFFILCVISLFKLFTGSAMGISEQEILALSTQNRALLIISAITGLVLGGMLQLKTLEQVGMGIMAMIECAYLPLLAILSYFILDERLAGQQWLGACLVIFSIYQLSRLSLGRKANQQNKPSLRGLVTGLLCQLTLAVSAVCIKPLVDDLTALQLLQMRLMVAVVVASLLIALLFKQGAVVELLRRKQSLPGLFMGGFFCICLSSYLWILGLRYLQATESAVIAQSSTLMSIGIGALFLKERHSLKTLGLALLAALGVLLVALH